MKKKYMAVAMALAISTMITGCSLSDVPSAKDMLVGHDPNSMDYEPAECIELPEYKGIEVDCTITDEEIQSQIDNLLQNNKEKMKKGTCKKGDEVNIDYSGKVNGKKFDRGTAKDQTITLGNSGMIEGFDDAIIGMKVGEKKDAKMQFPKDYHEKKLAGKKVVFTLKVNYISKKGTFNDAFVRKNTDYKTTAEYNEKTKEKLATQKKESAGYTAFQNLMEKMKLKETPKSLEEKWTKIFNNELESQAKQYNVPVEQLLSYMGGGTDKDTYIKQQVESQVKQVLVVQAIAEKENIEVTDEEIKEEIKQASAQAQQSEEDYRKGFDEYFQKAETLEGYMKFNLLGKKILEIIKQNAKIKE